jgi:osmoprotectant transport system permease protein
MNTTRYRDWFLLLAATVAFIVLIVNTAWWQSVLHYFFPDVSQVLHPRAPLPVLVLEHIEMVAISSGLTVLIGIPLGIWVTRRSGRSFLPIVTTVTSFGQTFPPVAVLALAVPIMGFGLKPTVVALFLYGLLPVVRNTVAGLEAVAPGLVDTARGLGMSRQQALWKVELPMAARVIIAGVRISVIINIGTAMIGAVIGAGGLGSPIVAGLVQNNLAFVIEGAVPAALLAILVDQYMARIEDSFVFALPATG